MRTTIFFIIITVAVIFPPAQAKAQVSTPSGNLETKISATVGEFYLSTSGFISPYASVVLSLTDGTFLLSTVADAQGNFSFEKVPIQRGMTGFCLTAVDFKQLGESQTCFSFPPAEDSIIMKDIFLSPTLGLSRNEIGPGGSASAFGYTMPGATVTLYISADRILTATADSTGYYEIQIQNIPPGQYSLYAIAGYNGKQSIEPTKKTQLKILSTSEEATNTLRSLLDRVIDLITKLWFGPLLFAIPLFIIIFLLIKKLWPGHVQLFSSQLPSLPGKKEEKMLHHWWFIGY